MAKLLLIVTLLAIASSAIAASDKLFHEHDDGVPGFFKLNNQNRAKLCCARCDKENDCVLVSENVEHHCRGVIDPKSIGITKYPGGRRASVHQRPNDQWSLLWIDNGENPVLKSRRFSHATCSWTSDVFVNGQVEHESFNALMIAFFYPKHYTEVLASLAPANCGDFKCDVTVYKRSTRINPKTKQTETERLPRDEL